VSLGSGFLFAPRQRKTPAQLHAFFGRSWFSATKKPGTMKRAVSIWPTASKAWLLVRDDGEAGPGLAFDAAERAKNWAYQGVTDGIGWSLPGILGNHLGGRTLWFREYAPERALLLELDGAKLVYSQIGTALDVCAWLSELGAPDPSVTPPRGKATRTYRARKAYGLLPTAAHAELLARLRAAIDAGDARAAGPIVVSLAKDAVLDVAVPWLRDSPASPFFAKLGALEGLPSSARELLLVRAIESGAWKLVAPLVALYAAEPRGRSPWSLGAPARALVAAGRGADARALLALADGNFRCLEIDLALETLLAEKKATPDLARWLGIGDRYVAWSRAKGRSAAAKLAALRARSG
jgi:hypothetical protein